MKLSRFFHLWNCNVYWLLQPRNCRNNSGLGYFHFARHYFGNRFFLSLPVGTKMFQFPTFPSVSYVFWYRYHIFQYGGFPHSEIHGSKPVLRFPVAYRSILRPSSAPSAKASAMRTSLLDLSAKLITFVNFLTLFTLDYQKNLFNSRLILCLFTFVSNYAIFKVRFIEFSLIGGLKWTWTTHLTLIRRAL